MSVSSQVFQVGFWCCKRQSRSSRWEDWDWLRCALPPHSVCHPPLCVCSPVCLSQEFKVRFWCCKRQSWSTWWVDQQYFDGTTWPCLMHALKIETGYGMHSPLAVFAIPSLCVCSPVWLSQEFQVRFWCCKRQSWSTRWVDQQYFDGTTWPCLMHALRPMRSLRSSSEKVVFYNSIIVQVLRKH